MLKGILSVIHLYYSTITQNVIFLYFNLKMYQKNISYLAVKTIFAHPGNQNQRRPNNVHGKHSYRKRVLKIKLSLYNYYSVATINIIYWPQCASSNQGVPRVLPFCAPKKFDNHLNPKSIDLYYRQQEGCNFMVCGGCSWV